MRKMVGQVNGDAATKGVPDNTETGIFAGPGERARGEHKEDLREVEAFIIGEVAYAIRKAAAE
jgi:hypothetical protein